MNRLSRRLYALCGLGLLGFAAGVVALCVALFNQVFTTVLPVSVHIARAGLQLLPGSDVQVRGIVVGSVTSITSDGNGALIRMALQPSRARLLPANVTVELVPKTLFGEKFVNLVLPVHPAGRLVAGAVIGEDRSTPALETDQALDDLLPLLRTVSPEQLDFTLSALATALAGRGGQLGATIDSLDAYLRRLDPQLPTLDHDLHAFVGMATTYATAATDLLRLAANLSATSEQVVSSEPATISAFLDDVTSAADTTRDLLAANATNLIEVNQLSAPVTALLARYSPEFPCFFTGYANLVPRIHAAVPSTPGLNHAAHVVVRFVPSFPVYQYPIDLPQFGDTRGPDCYGLPNPPLSLPVVHYADGTQHDPRFASQGQSGLPLPAAGSAPAGSAPAGTTAAATGMGSAGTAEEKALVDALLAPVLQIRADSVPDIADLLWGPLARGDAVSLSLAGGAS